MNDTSARATLVKLRAAGIASSICASTQPLMLAKTSSTSNSSAAATTAVAT